MPLFDVYFTLTGQATVEAEDEDAAAELVEQWEFDVYAATSQAERISADCVCERKEKATNGDPQ